MIKNEAYKNRKVATSAGHVHFDETGHGKGDTARAEELLARLDGFTLVKEKEPVEEKKEPAKKAPVRKTAAKKEASEEEPEKVEEEK